ncbi:pentapeptide repeat-containing protein [Sandaracinus amylolyticus]|uniref:pentapeptide repeat-containing protein n=1 Tax=Sandaracinus amylolyticus TaxID=927083 RepID=UPI001F3B367E|nr:pentapeptide repeat-containing protein [Sandaracinus amylolyticus]UJR83918.1 Hypothetical protein I5071_59890 [Sandaracinus amylolyticus]
MLERVAPIAARAVRDRRCEDCDLTYATLRGSDLSGGRFHDTIFVHADGRDVNLRDADLSETALGGDFTGADFRGANLRDASVHSAVFRNARLDGVDLRAIRHAEAADWAEAVLEGANLENVRFTGPHGAVDRTTPGQPMGVANGGTDLAHANLRGARLAGATLERCSLRGADLRGADLTGAHLSGADLSDADLRDATLDRATLLGTDLRGANLQDAQLSRARFSGRLPEGDALLTGATWTDGRVCGAGSDGRCIRSSR